MTCFVQWGVSEGMIDRSGTSADAGRLRVLHLLEQQKITATEAAELLEALDEAPRESSSVRRRGRWAIEEHGPEQARWLRVRVTDQRTGRVRTNVSVPIGMIGAGLGIARRLRLRGVSEHMDDVVEAVRSGRKGVLFDVASESGERVEILID